MSLPAFLQPPDRRLTPDKLHGYQKTAIHHQCTLPFTNLWLDMGLGKTVITLTSIVQLQDHGWLGSVLVVGTKTIIDTVWMQQAAEWTHTKHLRFIRLTGNPAQRLRKLAIPADVYLINYEQLRWLSETLTRYYLKTNRPLPFNGVVWDEIAKMKNSASKRSRAVQSWLPHMKWRTGLTGTPASNGYLDLHGQYKALDLGERLGPRKTAFKERWFMEKGPYRLVPRPTAEKEIHDLIADITIEMSAQEYNPLPDMITNDLWVTMPQDLLERYKGFEKDMFMDLDNGTIKEVFCAAARTNSCLQISNGAVYLNPGQPEFEAVHDLKLDALERILDESPGQPILVAYAYKSDAARIMERFKTERPINLTSAKDRGEALEQWKRGEVRLMLGHPDSMGHGTDGLQRRGNILVWFGPTWRLDLYKQFNARLRRQGQAHPVICHRILTRDTLDMAVVDAIAHKDTTEQGLRAAIRRYRNRSLRVI